MEPYRAMVKPHNDLGKYNIPLDGNEEKEVDRILAMYSGSIVNPNDEEQYSMKDAAKLSLNALMCASERVRRNGGAGRHYGVGFRELETAAEVGVYLMERCGIEEGKKTLRDFITIHYKQGIPFTRENATKTLTLFNLLENGTSVSHDHYMHDGGMEH